MINLRTGKNTIQVISVDIHIQLGKPEYVRCFPKFEKLDKTPCFATDQNGSQFAYSAPFQVTSIYNELVDELMSYRR